MPLARVSMVATTQATARTGERTTRAMPATSTSIARLVARLARAQPATTTHSRVSRGWEPTSSSSRASRSGPRLARPLPMLRLDTPATVEDVVVGCELEEVGDPGQAGTGVGDEVLVGDVEELGVGKARQPPGRGVDAPSHWRAQSSSTGWRRMSSRKSRGLGPHQLETPVGWLGTTPAQLVGQEPSAVVGQVARRHEAGLGRRVADVERRVPALQRRRPPRRPRRG